MNDTKRTGIFIAVAAVSVVIAVLAKPPKLNPLKSVPEGQLFFPDFTDPNAASSLDVVMFDEQKGRQHFNVEFKNGLWTIPSHNDYPADGKDRLAKTAASLIGIKRDQFKSSSAADHEALGVVDPSDDTITTVKGRGDRITLRNASGGLLADFIIGKRVADRDGYYYVRKADETSTYVAKLDVDLSTKFSDWVDTDLLDVSTVDLRKIVVNKYSIDESSGTVTDAEVSDLSRPDSNSDSWKLAGLDTEHEELNKDSIRDLTSTLADMKLIGVRKKPEGLSAGLKANDKLQLDQLTILELQSRGFFVVPQRGLLSNEGEIVATAQNGVSYVLRFGEIFTGSELEIETGIEAAGEKKNDQAKAETKAAASSQDKAENAAGQETKDTTEDSAQPAQAKTESDSKPAEGSKQGRYLFVTAQFDPTMLGEKPAEPLKPEGIEPESTDTEKNKDQSSKEPEDAGAETKNSKPDSKEQQPEANSSTPPEAASGQGEQAGSSTGQTPPGQDQEKKNAANAEQAKPETDEAKSQSESAKPEEATSPNPIQAEPKKDLKKEYEDALSKYKRDLEEYNRKVDEAQKKIKNLNLRFADWYYVISEDSFKKLRLSRSDLVKPKEKKEEAKETTTDSPSGQADDKDSQSQTENAAPPDEPVPDSKTDKAAPPDESGADSKTDKAGQSQKNGSAEQKKDE